MGSCLISSLRPGQDRVSRYADSNSSSVVSHNEDLLVDSSRNSPGNDTDEPIIEKLPIVREVFKDPGPLRAVTDHTHPGPLRAVTDHPHEETVSGQVLCDSCKGAGNEQAAALTLLRKQNADLKEKMDVCTHSPFLMSFWPAGRPCPSQSS